MERLVGRLKQYRRVATRYEKRTDNKHLDLAAEHELKWYFWAQREELTNVDQAQEDAELLIDAVLGVFFDESINHAPSQRSATRV